MKNEKKVDIIIQARIGSTRLKGKVLKKHRGLTPLKIMTGRLKYCNKIKDVIICTTRLLEDNRIVKFCKKEKIKNFFLHPLEKIEILFFLEQLSTVI